MAQLGHVSPAAFLSAPSERNKVDEVDHEPPGMVQVKARYARWRSQFPRISLQGFGKKSALRGRNAVVKRSSLVVWFAVN